MLNFPKSCNGAAVAALAALSFSFGCSREPDHKSLTTSNASALTRTDSLGTQALYDKWRHRILPDERGMQVTDTYYQRLLSECGKEPKGPEIETFDDPQVATACAINQALFTADKYSQGGRALVREVGALLQGRKPNAPTLTATVSDDVAFLLTQPRFIDVLKDKFGVESLQCKEYAAVTIACCLNRVPEFQHEGIIRSLSFVGGICFDSKEHPRGQGHAWVELDDYRLEASFVPGPDFVGYIPFVAVRMTLDSSKRQITVDRILYIDPLSH